MTQFCIMSLLLMLVNICYCDEEILLRPSAIIPWSQYQRRMSQMNKQITNFEENSISTSDTDNSLRSPFTKLINQPKPANFIGVYDPAPVPNYMIANPNFPTLPQRSQNRTHHKAIRPQLRGRQPTEPSDFINFEQLSTSLGNSSSIPTRTSRIGNIPRKKATISDGDSSGLLTTEKSFHQVSKFPYATVEEEINLSPKNIAIPNGVPMHAGMWDIVNRSDENRAASSSSSFHSNRRPVQKAANTLNVDLAGIPSIGSLNEAPFTYGNNLNQLAPTLEQLSQAVGGDNSPNIVNSIFSQSGAGGLPIQTVTVPSTQGEQALTNLLSNKGPLNQFTNLAKTLLGSGNEPDSPGGGLLDLMTNALKGPQIPKSSAIQDEYGANIDGAHQRGSLFEKLITQATSALHDSIKQKAAEDKLEKETSLKAKLLEFSGTEADNKFRMTKEKEDSLKLLKDLPEEERKILEAAILSDEVDLQSIAPALKNLVKDDQVESSKREKESRLIEWIKANRPKKVIEAPVTPDKLPYYGKYCGSFVKQNSTKDFRVSGALWAVDEYRFVVSKFYFQPDSLLTENATFWIGPDNPYTDNVLKNVLPSVNGFYVKPKPIDVSIFAMNVLPPISAKARKPIIAAATMNGSTPILPMLEFTPKNQTDRVKRQTSIIRPLSEASIDEAVTASTKKPIELLVKGGVVKIDPNTNNPESNLARLEESKPETKDIAPDSEPKKTFVAAGLRLKQPDEEITDQNMPQPLEWYEGFQPLLLTLPKNKKIKEINWVSLRDHKRSETIASVMIPNGAAFKIPAPVALNPMTANHFYNISTGTVRVLDIKTIVIENLHLRTDGQLLWFMAGKDILPNINGHIVPIYHRERNFFDCESLRDYYGETITLRLPGALDMKDVFWLSIFSIPTAISHSHIYFPYNEMQLPPDLSGILTPSCKYEP